MWREIDAWGSKSVNVDSEGRPVAGATAPAWRIELDSIRLSTDGPLRTTLDDYYDDSPEQTTWWYANGIHEYGSTHAVEDACDAIE